MEEITRLKWTLFARNAALLTLALVGGYWLGGEKYHFERDWSAYLMNGLFVILLSWLLLPNFRLDDGHLNDTSHGFALRLGKATKRCLRRLKSLF